MRQFFGWHLSKLIGEIGFDFRQQRGKGFRRLLFQPKLEHLAINLNQRPTSLSLSKGCFFFVCHAQPIERKTILRQAQDERVWGEVIQIYQFLL